MHPACKNDWHVNVTCFCVAGTSRCLKCCENEDELDCCHCGDERHASNPLTVNFNGIVVNNEL